jgi:hypothetical protein
MDDEWINLVEIIRRQKPDYGDRRVAAFIVHSDGIEILEMCDEYFSVKLTRDEVNRLVDWLNAWLASQA